MRRGRRTYDGRTGAELGIMPGDHPETDNGYGGYEPVRYVVGRNVITGDIFYSDGSIQRGGTGTIQPAPAPTYPWEQPTSILDNMGQSMRDAFGAATENFTVAGKWVVVGVSAAVLLYVLNMLNGQRR